MSKRQIKSHKGGRTDNLSIRLKPDEKERLNTIAKSFGLSIPDYIMRKVNEDMITIYAHDFYGNVETLEFTSAREVQEWFAEWDGMGHEHLYTADIDLMTLDSDEFQSWLENPGKVEA